MNGGMADGKTRMEADSNVGKIKLVKALQKKRNGMLLVLKKNAEYFIMNLTLNLEKGLTNAPKYYIL